MIEPFANNHQSMQIGELVIENQTDKIIVYGDIELTLDAAGYEQACQLHQLTCKIIQAFEQADVCFEKDSAYLEKDMTYSNNEVKSKQKDDQLDRDIDNPFL